MVNSCVHGTSPCAMCPAACYLCFGRTYAQRTTAASQQRCQGAVRQYQARSAHTILPSQAPIPSRSLSSAPTLGQTSNGTLLLHIKEALVASASCSLMVPHQMPVPEPTHLVANREATSCNYGTLQHPPVLQPGMPASPSKEACSTPAVYIYGMPLSYCTPPGTDPAADCCGHPASSAAVAVRCQLAGRAARSLRYTRLQRSAVIADSPAGSSCSWLPST
jgi:hypothetical protein